jgi:hypothetical protein
LPNRLIRVDEIRGSTLLNKQRLEEAIAIDLPDRSRCLDPICPDELNRVILKYEQQSHDIAGGETQAKR